MSRNNLADESALEFSRVFDFAGKVVLITGAASGIGKASTTRFAPLIIAAASLERNMAAYAISLGLAKRPTGISARAAATPFAESGERVPFAQPSWRNHRETEG
jgi:NAD(P)-dependent dehydrogenase (short-subunit alcohol dehydrogenase family)